MHINRVLFLGSALGLATGSVVNAQDVNTAFYLANVTTQGTARSMGFGNALGSIGGDFSSASVNPAGLGIYRSSELAISPSLRMNSSSSAYQGVQTGDNNLRFNFNHFGLVATDAPKGKRYERRAWKTVSFAFGINRVADFNRDFSYSGNNYSSSGTLEYEYDANNNPNSTPGNTQASNTSGYLGYQSYLINRANNGGYYSVVPFEGGVRQQNVVKERGRVQEYVLSLGGNYKEKLMLGGTLGIPSIKYSMTSNYTETLAAGNSAANPDNFSSYRTNRQLDITGVGINLKLGAIYKVDNNLRIGAAIHSPSYYALNDNYTQNVYSTVGGQSYEVSVANGMTLTNSFNYGLITPWRGILSASYLFKGKGFITADYEYADYGFTQFDYPWSDGYTNAYDNEEAAINSTLSSMYKGTSNIRIGGEILITKYFMARAGFGYYSNPYVAAGIDGSRMDISGGIGFRADNFFADVALVHSAYQLRTAPYYVGYNDVPQPVAVTDYGMNNLAFTIGTKF